MIGSALQDVTILDLSRLIPGAAVTHYFADFGANVVKIEEPPTGDYLRDVRPQIDGLSLQEITLDRNKHSIALRLHTPEGQAALHAMVAEADAIVAVSPQEAMRSRGADYETLRALNEGLVYLSFTGFGEGSRYTALPTHGGNLAAFAGVHGLDTRTDGVIVPAPLPYGRYRIPMEQASLYAAFALLSALHQRARNGAGLFLDIPITSVLMAADYAAMGDWVNNRGSYMVDLPQPTPTYGLYRTADDKVLVVCPIEKRFWMSFCDVMGRDDLRDRCDWSGNSMDFAPGNVELYWEVQRVIATRPRADWLDALIEARVPCSPAYTIDEAVNDPDIGGRMWVDATHPVTGRPIRYLVPPGINPASFRATPAPAIGESRPT
jgi:crotonobetainyl-CoA:carnitine CoA-transferase CaiB-like acyl-CoA transferase